MGASVKNTGVERTGANRRVFALVEVAGQVELLQVGVSPVHKKMVQMVGH
jgi:hypothetical protein